MFNIERDIPAPNYRGKYPFARMEPGDSFFVPGQSKEIKSARVTASKHAAKTGQKFTTRTVEGGVRIWRVQ